MFSARQSIANVIQKRKQSLSFKGNQSPEQPFSYLPQRQKLDDEQIRQIIKHAKNNQGITTQQKYQLIQYVSEKIEKNLNKYILLPHINIKYYPLITLMNHYQNYNHFSCFILQGNLRLYTIHKNHHMSQQKQNNNQFVAKHKSYEDYQQSFPHHHLYAQYNPDDCLGQLFSNSFKLNNHTLISKGLVVLQIKQISKDTPNLHHDGLPNQQKVQLLNKFHILKPVFKKISTMINQFNYKRYIFKEQVYRCGDKPKNIYFVIQGQVSFQQIVQDKKQKQLNNKPKEPITIATGVLGPFMYFGQQQIILNTKRTQNATVKSASCILLQLSRQKFSQLLQDIQFGQIVKKQMTTKISQRLLLVEKANQYTAKKQQNTSHAEKLTESDIKTLTGSQTPKNKKSFSKRQSKSQNIKVMHGKVIKDVHFDTSKVQFSMLHVNPDHFNATKDKYRKYHVKPLEKQPSKVRDFKKIWRVLNLQQVLRQQQMILPNQQGKKFFESHRKIQQHLAENHSLRPKTTSSTYRTKMQYIKYLNQFNL